MNAFRAITMLPPKRSAEESSKVYKRHMIATGDFESKHTWEQQWTTDKPEFYREEVNAMLIKQHHEFAGGRKNLRILVPLCGKSLDMIWLADQGHSVVGVELIRKGIEVFLCDNKLTHREEPITLALEKQGTVFKVNEKDISLFECSIFDFSAEVAGEQFDCIWDRGSMTAINMMNEERLQQYRDIMLACLKPDGRYFLEFFAPAESLKGMSLLFKFISKKSLTELFGQQCTIRYLGKQRMPEEYEPEAYKAYKIKALEESPGTERVNRLFMWMHYYFIDVK